MVISQGLVWLSGQEATGVTAVCCVQVELRPGEMRLFRNYEVTPLNSLVKVLIASKVLNPAPERQDAAASLSVPVCYSPHVLLTELARYSVTCRDWGRWETYSRDSGFYVACPPVQSYGRDSQFPLGNLNASLPPFF